MRISLMPSLADCFKKYNVPKQDQKTIRDKLNGYLEDRYEPEAARVSAVEDMINELEADKKDIYAQVQAHIDQQFAIREEGRRKEDIPVEQERRVVDRRKDFPYSKKVAEMSTEEMQQALLKDDLTGLDNARGFWESFVKENSSHVARLDMDNLHDLNDVLGYKGSDQLIKKIAEKANELGIYLAREKGDEFVSHGNPKRLHQDMGKLTSILDKAKIIITTEDGSVYEKTGIGVSYGIEKTLDKAEGEQKLAKLRRLAEGKRIEGRAGGKLPGLVKIDTKREGQKGRVRDKLEAKKKAEADRKEQIKQEVAKKKAKLAERGSVEVPAKKKKLYSFQNKEIENRVQQSKNPQKESIAKKTKELFVTIGHKMSRTFEHLPKTKEFARLQFDLLKLQKQKAVSNHKTLSKIEGILINLDKESYNLFWRKVILDDLVETSKDGGALPFGFDEKTLAQEVKALDKAMTKEAIDAVARRKEVWKDLRSDYIKAQEAIGHKVESRMQRENYFRHQVLAHAQTKQITGSGKKLKSPTGRSHLKKRTGSGLDISSNYLEAESEVIAQMLYDIQVAETISSIDKNYNIADKIKKEAKKQGKKWREIIPEGYSIWQPRDGTIFYLADTIPARLAEQLTSDMLESMNISKDDITKVLALGGRRNEMVLKNEIVETLNSLHSDRTENMFVKGHRTLIQKWKQWQLISPRRWPKYNIRNISGDADIVFAGSPSIFLKSPQAAYELFQVYAKGMPMTKNLEKFFDRGGFEANLQTQEMGEINRLKMFRHLQDEKGNFKEIPIRVWQGYWKAARLSTDFREGILRYAAFIKAQEIMNKSGDGLPKSYWASSPAEIQGLDNIDDRAYWMANDLLGAYDRVSIVGQVLREHIFHFWSFKEVNMRRYKRLVQNAVNDKQAMAMIGRKTAGIAIKSPLIAARIGAFVFKAVTFSAILQLWNNTKYPEEEEQLPKSVREKPHVILGVDEKTGEITYFSRLGALSDLLEWFNLDQAPSYLREYMTGEKSLRDIAREMAKAPVNIMAQGSLPFTKLAGELLTRRALYPDVFNPTVIRDQLLHIGKSFGVDKEYLAISDKPSKPYKSSFPGLLVYKVDPLQAAYGDVFEMKRRYLKKIGEYGEGFWLTDSGNALYNFKKAVRYEDKAAAEKYLADYLMLKAQQGVTAEKAIKSLSKAFDNMHPMAGMSIKDQINFAKSLSKKDKEKLKMAVKYYFILRTTPPGWEVK